MRNDPFGGALVGSEIVLYVDTVKQRDISKEAISLAEEMKKSYGIRKVRVIDVLGGYIGEPVPYIATYLGIWRGMNQIRYVADRGRIWQGSPAPTSSD